MISFLFSFLFSPKLYRKRQKSLILLNDSNQQKFFSPLRTIGKLKRSLSSPQKFIAPNPDACIYCIYLIIFSRILSSEFTTPIVKHNPPSLTQIMSRLHISRPLSISSNSETIQKEKFSDLVDSTNNSFNKQNNDDDHQVDNIESLFGDIELTTIVRTISDDNENDNNSSDENCKNCNNCDGDVNVESTQQLLQKRRQQQQINDENKQEDQLKNHKEKGFVNYHDNITEEAVLIANAAIEV